MENIKEREDIKKLKEKIHSANLPEHERLAFLRMLDDRELYEQAILNLSFNKEAGLLQVIMMGQCLEDGTLKAIQVDKEGRVILSPKK